MLSQVSIPDLVVLAVAGVAGFGALRSKRGDFYKSVAEEKTAESDRLRTENEKLRDATDITPLKETLEELTAVIQNVVDTNAAVFTKVAEMNGSLRHHGEAMKALADKLILDEAARGLLRAAAQPPSKPS